MANINRRRYAVLIRFLQDTIRNPKVSHRVRMAAAVRLDTIYSRHEWFERRMQDRKAKAEGQTPLPSEGGDADGSSDVQTDARSFLARIQSRDVESGDSSND